MNKTFCTAEMKFNDVTALGDATEAAHLNQSYGDLELFKSQTALQDYATLEQNLFVLDGSKVEMPEAPADVAFMSTETSNSNCAFTTVPYVEVGFTAQHSSAGLTLYFGEDYPALIRVTWYTLAGTKLIAKEYSPDALVYVIENQITNYGKVKIEFLRTRFPFQYARLQYILYGLYVKWTGAQVKNADILEEVNPISETLSINTANITVLDPEGKFDYTNANGWWRSVQKNQEVTITETVNGEDIPAGTFFIDEKSYSSNAASFKLIDAIGLLDNQNFYEGEIYSNENAGAIIDAIMAAAGVTKYEVAADIASIKLSGWLAPQTCREALQMVCFVTGAVADDSRSDTISIYKPDRYVSQNIGPSRKFYGNTSAELGEYVSGVTIECTNYTLKTEPEELYKGELSAGLNTITFTEPILTDSVAISGGNLSLVKTNYVIVNMNEPGEVVITGNRYEETRFTYQKTVPRLDAGEVENFKSYGTMTLYNTAELQKVAVNILDFYSLRQKLSLKYLLQNEQSGDWALIRDRKGNNSTTLIESQSVSLTGGFIAKATCRGYSKLVTDTAYTGEIYAGEGAFV